MSTKTNLKSHLVHLNDYNIVHQVNSGGFGIVYLLEHKSTKARVAAKVNVQGTAPKENLDIAISREIGIFIRVRSPTIVRFYGFSLTDFDNKHNPTILMEYIDNGSLKHLIEQEEHNQSPHEYDNTAKQIILCGIAHGMMVLHSRRVIHRDLKPDNVLIDSNYHPHITDFGLSKFLDPDNSKSQSMSGCGTPPYIAPEILQSNQYGPKADVYAFGILMFEVVTGQRAYPELYRKDKQPTFVSFSIEILKGKRPVFTSPIKKSFQKLIEQCWSANPNERPSFRELFHKLSLSQEDDDDTITSHLKEIISGNEDIENEEFEYSQYCLDDVDYDRVLDYVEDITDQNTDLKDIINNQQKHIKELEERTQQQIDALEQKYQQQHNDMSKKHSNEIKQMEQKYQQQHNDLSKKHSKEIKQMEQKYQEEIDKLTTQVASITNQLEKVLNSNTNRNTAQIIDINDFSFSHSTSDEHNWRYFHYANEAFNKKTNEPFAILKFWSNNYESWLPQLLTLSASISGIIKIIGYQPPCEDTNNDLIIVTDFMKNGSLEIQLDNYHHKNQKDKLNSTVRTKIIFGIASTMKKLHENNYGHGMLIPSQILIDDNFEPLISFNYYRYLHEDEVYVYPPYFEFSVDPKISFFSVQLQEEIDFPSRRRSDVYAFAIILYRMFVGKLSLNLRNRCQSTDLIVKAAAKGKRPERQSCIPDCYWELIERCWQQNPEDRPTFAEITEILKDDQYVLHDNGEPDLNEIHRYRIEIEK